MANPCYAQSNQQRQSPFHAKVKVDCWSSLCQLLICPPPIIKSVNNLHVDHLYIVDSSPGSTVSIPSMLIASMSITDLPSPDQQCWLPPHQLPLHQLLISPPRINSVDSLCINCLYINRWSTPPPQDQQCWSPLHQSLITSASTVGRPPPTDFDFLIFTRRMIRSVIQSDIHSNGHSHLTGISPFIILLVFICSSPSFEMVLQFYGQFW